MTSGRGKDARAGRLMTAARPCVTVFLCSSAEKLPWTGRSGESKHKIKDIKLQKEFTKLKFVFWFFLYGAFRKQPWLSKSCYRQ